MGYMQYLSANIARIGEAFTRHILLIFVSVVIATVIGIPICLLLTKFDRMERPVFGLFKLFNIFPAFALFGILVFYFGTGFLSAVIVIFLYALFPIIRQTSLGIENISEQVIEASRSMGMTRMQNFRVIYLPLTLPRIINGIRIATIQSVGIAIFAAYIGAGGLGEFIFYGFEAGDIYELLTGGLFVFLLALIEHIIFRIVEYTISVDFGSKKL